jgi:hypothetical protein
MTSSFAILVKIHIFVLADFAWRGERASGGDVTAIPARSVFLVQIF